MIPRLTLALMAVGLTAAQAVPQEPATEADSEGSRVVRGTAAAADSAPWQIQIFSTIAIREADLAADRARAASDPRKMFYADMQPWERDHLCGGVLIAPGWALSAAHCFVNREEELKPLGSRRVRLGNVYLPAATEMAIERVIVHGDYRRTGNKRHDIALIKLVPDKRTDAGIADFARPAKVLREGQRPLQDGDRLKVTGWGMTGEQEAGALRGTDGKAMRGSPALLEARLALVDAKRCRAVPSYRRTLWDGVLCVAGDDTGQDSCQGDSGGPLTRQTFLVGLVSSGSGCGLKGVPALYTRVGAYTAWIEAAMASSPAGVVVRCKLASPPGRPTLSCDGRAVSASVR